MNIDLIPVGENPPWDVNMIVENPVAGNRVKYELDKKSGAMFVDRFLHTNMYYPGNYGFVPHTLSGDGDPVDVLCVGDVQVFPGSVLRVRPVGVLVMTDEAGEDEKIVAVPVSKLYPFFDKVKTVGDLPEIERSQIGHFFKHYKDLEKDKWVDVKRWGDADEAAAMIKAGIDRAA
ncbi:inorganic diphosphatase [Fodinicurvata sp. EGI_FJ10296]|uniref:inorganic diphosphatase n=1 Tax=Fodinicurvata sp. EGI_FJ10296 TaxID=3231908 RepID=UPI0034521441